MKCSQTKCLIYIMLTIFVSPTTSRLLSYLAPGKKMNVQNVINPKTIITNFDLFPDLHGPDIKHHKIVKKQMTNFDYVCKKKSKRSLKKSSLFSQNYSRFMQIPNKVNEDKTPDSLPSFAEQVKTFTPVSNSFFMDPSAAGKKKLARRVQLSDTEERIIESSLKQLRRGYFRIPDNEDYRFFYECETEPNGYLQVQRKRCPDGEVFEPKFLECLKLSFLKTFRHKRGPIFRKKIGIPDPPPDPQEMEHPNEWIDASAENGLKIPCEFKPKQKPRLKIFYLRSKRKRLSENEKDPNAEHRFLRSFHATFNRKKIFQHHLPRSFFVRKETKGESQSLHDNKVSEEEEDSDDDDEEDEIEEEEEEEGEKRNQKGNKRLGKEWRSKDYIKPNKDTASDKAKYIESPGPMSFDNNNINTKTNKNNNNNNNNIVKSKLKSEEVAKSELYSGAKEKENKKVLIDASIKVDSSISNALKNIITSSKEKNMDETEAKVKSAVDKQEKIQLN